MKEKAYVVGFTLAVTAVFGLLVASLHAALQEKRAQNSRVAEQRALLELAEVKPADKDWSAARVLEAFDRSFLAMEWTDGDGRPFTVYGVTTVADGGEPLAVFPVEGAGFWDRILGYMMVNLRRKTVEGLVFIEHGETPGLGARIEEPAFTKQFEGLRYDRKDDEGRRIRVGGAGGGRRVDAITGATETSRAVETLINESIDRFVAAYERLPKMQRENLTP
jgi:Na+-transporting NADH:ubiquinone oxidoreductase subunit C